MKLSFRIFKMADENDLLLFNEFIPTAAVGKAGS